MVFRLKYVWWLHNTIFQLTKLLQICVYVSIAVLFLTKNSRHTSSQHSPFEILNSSTRLGHERFPRFIKVTTKTNINCCSTFNRFEQTLHLFWVFFWPFYKTQVNVQCGIGSISMPITSHIHNAVDHVIAKNICQSYFKTFQVLFCRKQQGAIMTDWKTYPCFLFHFSMNIFSITVFQVVILLSIFSTTQPSLTNVENRWM